MGLEERRKKERLARRNQILKAARKLFFDKGFKPITIDHIARKAELSKGAVYLYFNSKEEIYIQILLADINKFNQKVNIPLNTQLTASALLKEFCMNYAIFFLVNGELFRILMTYMIHADGLNFSEELNRKLIKEVNLTIETVERILVYGINEGEFDGAIEVRANRNALWGLLNGVISLHLFTGSEATRSERILSTLETSLDIFIAGLNNRS
ncbi:MAG: TetR/AcrR family transcriptional regulator [Syntrophaceae bacterium]